MTKMNTEVIEDAIGRILEVIGEDCNQQGLVDTHRKEWQKCILKSSPELGLTLKNNFR